MELDKNLNREYVQDKKALEKVKGMEKTVKELQEKLKPINRAIEDAELTLKRAKEDKDKSLIKETEKKLEELKDKKFTEMRNVKEIQADLKRKKEAVDKHFEEIEKDPELKAYINSILEKQYNRELSKGLKEQEQLTTLQEAIKENPSLNKYLRGLVRTTEELDKVNEKLGKLDAIKDKKEIEKIKTTDIPKLTGKKKANREAIEAIFEKNKIELSIEFIDSLVKNNGFVHEKVYHKGGEIEDVIHINESLKNISKGYEKRINTYTKAIEKIPGAKIYETNQSKIQKNLNKEQQEEVIEEQEEESIEEEETTGFHPIKRFRQWREDRQEEEEFEEEEEIEQEENLPDVIEETRNPFKIFGRWISRKVQEIKNGKEEQETEEEVTEKKETEEKEEPTTPAKDFKTAYKFDIIQDYVKQKGQEVLHDAAKETREETKKVKTVEDNNREEEEIR